MLIPCLAITYLLGIYALLTLGQYLGKVASDSTRKVT